MVEGAGVDPTVTARELWLGTHPLPTASTRLGRRSMRPSATVLIKMRSCQHRLRPYCASLGNIMPPLAIARRIFGRDRSSEPIVYAC